MSTVRQMRQLARKSLDERAAELKKVPRPARAPPRGGWIRAIRDALGMPRSVLGKRMGVGERRITQLEAAEPTGKITVESLRRAADALDCELVIAFLPRKPLQKVLDDKRAAMAASWLQSNAMHTMAMENQAVHLQDLPASVLHQVEQQLPDERLWDDEAKSGTKKGNS